ncbi:uncharacterized protein LOC130710416 isoform X2 [Lotus japonicus]|uniref:uncharacterized protein LOC130710416 isoform X2 n=1 Tax=Lotus japonicus TaxID=34305 RepID=UPI00258A0D43|nr:uncharacterized protein LOC130710416 isoform X2 [Lotus japonicus]
MAVETSGGANLLCGSDIGNDDDVPVQISDMGGTSSSKSSHNLVKKSKSSSYDDDDIAFSSIVKKTAVSADKSLSMLKKFIDKELALVEECQRKRQVEEQRLHSLQTKIEECVCDFVTKEAQHSLLEDLLRECELQLKTKEVEIHQVMHNMNKEQERKEEELEIIFRKVARCTKELKTKEEKLDAINKLIDGQSKELDKVISTRAAPCAQMKDFESMKKQLDGRIKEFNFKEEEFRRQVKVIESNFGSQAKDLESKRKQLEEQLKEFKLKEKQLKCQEKELESKNKYFDSLEKELKSQKKQLEDEPELLENEILVDLEATSDPSKVVLDIIQNPIVSQIKNGDDAVIMDRSHIFLLQQLLRISPQIKPHVREDAMKLALDLKANMRTSTENSLEVLGFVLLLSIYGLVPTFDEYEVLKLFEFAAQHKQVVELFQTLGFVDKISDFVQKLINKQQYIEAVRFICAFKLVDKNQPVDLLREYVQNAKRISEISCKNTNSLEIKDKARDHEIATLTNVLQCISDNNLESEDLFDEIKDRILELNKQKDCLSKMEEDWKPKLGVAFDSFEDAWKFWADYGGRVGFGARKQYTHRKKDGSISSCRFVCCNEGLRKPDKRDYKTINARPETRTDCKARLGLKNMCGKLIVHDFMEEHNHILYLQETTHMLSSQGKVSEVQCHQNDLADDAELHRSKGSVECQLSKRRKIE